MESGRFRTLVHKALSQDGLVVGESPPGGRQVPNGAAVVIYVGSATS